MQERAAKQVEPCCPCVEHDLEPVDVRCRVDDGLCTACGQATTHDTWCTASLDMSGGEQVGRQAGEQEGREAGMAHAGARQMGRWGWG